MIATILRKGPVFFTVMGRYIPFAGQDPKRVYSWQPMAGISLSVWGMRWTEDLLDCRLGKKPADHLAQVFTTRQAIVDYLMDLQSEPR